MGSNTLHIDLWTVAERNDIVSNFAASRSEIKIVKHFRIINRVLMSLSKSDFALDPRKSEKYVILHHHVRQLGASLRPIT